VEATEDSQPIGASPPAATHARAYPILFWGAAVGVVLLDQATKAIVRTSLDRGESWPDWDMPFRLTHVVNSGAAWGILQDQTAFLVIMATIGIGAIYLYYRNPPYNHWTATLGIGLLLGGALGNLIDRVRLGHVTDFLDPDNFPTFNVADSAINVGIAVLVIGYLVWGVREDQPSKTDTTEPDATSPTDG